MKCRFGFVEMILMLASFGISHGQTCFKVAGLNVENFFDYRLEKNSPDKEFSSLSLKKWTKGRYWRKIISLSKEVIALGEDHPADLVALCEIENDSVLYDLTRRGPLRTVGYEYLLTDGLDERGMNVALLYQPATFKPLKVYSYRVKSLLHQRPTRDVLYASGKLQNGDTLDVFVCHLPSRRGGSSLAEDYRFKIMKNLRIWADSIMDCRACPQIIVTGDFNDSYADRSLRKGLKAESAKDRKTFSDKQLYCLSAEKRGNHTGIYGTYYFRQRWEQLDQMIVNGRLLSDYNRLRTAYDNCRIADFPFLLVENALGDKVPFRTYQGPVYKGGYSDHLPLVTTFFYSW